MLTLRIVNGPLEDRAYEAVLSEYNRLTDSHISAENLRRWTQHSPDGPACHALLTTDHGLLVGHCCLFPFRMKCGDAHVVAAKAEYYFINEGYRSERIHGLQHSDKPIAVILLEQLYRYCRTLHWGPYIVSAPPGVDALHRMAGCRPITFPLSECLLVLRPWRAASATPNVTAKQRALLFLTGSVQGTASRAVLPFLSHRNGIRSVEVTEAIEPRRDPSVLRLSEDKDALGWRYPETEYLRVGTGDAAGNFVIAKSGSESAYLRVCQYRLDADDVPLSSLLVNLVRRARAQQALGLRWAVYDHSERPARLVQAMRTLGFVCARRERKFLLYTDDRQLLAPGRWDMADSLVTFDN